MIVQILRPASPTPVQVAQFKCGADGLAVFTWSLMNEHKIVAQFTSFSALNLQIGDYIVYSGIQFKMNTPPSETKQSSFGYQYSITFESPLYDLYNKLFMDEGESDFTYSGSPSDFIDKILQNINSLDNTWTKGAVDEADDQLISFTDISCREALNTIAQTFGFEYVLNNKEISLVQKVGADSSLVFAYGKGNGLYELSRQAIDDSNIVTRLYVFGSTKNTSDGKKMPYASNPIESNTDLYGIREGVQNFDDVYPHRESTATAVENGSGVGTDAIGFTDSTMDFDVNEYKTTDDVQIAFLSGDLTGYTFVTNAYDAVNKQFFLNKFTDTDGTILPNNDFQLRIGDKYTILGITMPPTYVAAAQAQLQSDGNDYIAQNSVPRVQYGLKIDQLWAQKNNILINIGDRVTIQDAAMGINSQIRVSAISYPLFQPYNITATISDSVTYTVAQRLIAKINNNQDAIATVDKNRQLDYRRGYANQQALHDLIFDTEGYYYSSKIKPLSIETTMLSVGAKSQAFQLAGAYFKIGNDNISASASAATLIHNAIQITGLGSQWAIATNATLSLPDTTSAYYLYARCSATQLTGTWVVDTAQHTVDNETGYYWFLVGVIYAVSEGYRGISLTYGYASINGRTIIAGKIQSLDGNVWFDLDANQFSMGTSASGIDWNYSSSNALTITGAIIQRAPGVVVPLPGIRGDWDGGTIYYSGDEVWDSGQTYTYIYPTPSKGNSVTNTTYWKISAAKGDTGNGVAGSAVTYQASASGTTVPTGTWTSTIPSVSPGQYLWTRIIITYTDSTTSTSYSVGMAGQTGATGAQGNYTEYRFAKNGSNIVAPSLVNTDVNPAGWSTTQPTRGLQEFVWIISAIKTAAGVLVTNWSDPSLFSGIQGDKGAAQTVRGIWHDDVEYHGTADLVEVVKYSDGLWYYTRVDAGDIPVGTLPTNATYWNPYGAEFQSVATDLFLAEQATIDNLIVTTLSTTADNTQPYLKAAGSEIDFWSAGTTDESDKGKALVRLGNAVCEMVQDSGGSSVATPGVAVRDVNKEIDGSEEYYSELSAGGIFSNASSINAIGLGFPANFSITALLQRRNSGIGGLSAAIYGNDQTSDTDGTSQSYGGWFNSLFAGGLHVAVTRITANYTASLRDTYISCENTGADITVTLPAVTSSTYIGKVYLIFRESSHGVTVNGNGNTLIWSTTSGSSESIGGTGGCLLAVWTGRYWQTNTL